MLQNFVTKATSFVDFCLRKKAKKHIDVTNIISYDATIIRDTEIDEMFSGG